MWHTHRQGATSRHSRVVDLVLEAERGPVGRVRLLANGAEALVIRAHVAAAAEAAVLLGDALGALVGGVVALVALLFVVDSGGGCCCGGCCE